MGVVNYIRKDLFNDSKFYSTLARIALPIVIQNLVASSLNMVDTIMIGRVGENELAAVGISNQYYLLYTILLSGLFAGCGIFISQYWGKKDLSNIKKVQGFGLLTGSVFALIFTLLAVVFPEKIISIFNTDATVINLGSSYLRIVGLSYFFNALTVGFSTASRSIGNSKLPMKVSIVALIINTVLNWVFIFGNLGAPALGVTGAAIATTIARIVECSVLIGYIYITKNELALKVKELSGITIAFIMNIIRTVLPTMLNDLLWVLGTTMYSIAYGRLGVQSMAAVQICTTVYNLCMVGGYGMAHSSAVIVGNEIGRGNEERAKDYSKKFAFLSILLGIILCIILNIAAPYIVTIFDVSDIVAVYARGMIAVMGINFLVKSFNLISVVGIFRGGADAKFALILETLTMWTIGVPLTFLAAFYFKFDIRVVYAMIIIEESVKTIPIGRRLFSFKWMKNVTLNK